MSRLTFEGRPVAVATACTGAATIFVIVDWPGVSEEAGPAELSTAAFPCGNPLAPALMTRVELSTAPTGEANVKVVVVDEPDANRPASYAVSIEEEVT